MKSFMIPCVLAIFAIIVDCIAIHWATTAFTSLDTAIIFLLTIVLPSLALGVGCVFYCDYDWGNPLSLRNISCSFLGGLFCCLACYIGFILIVRSLQFKQAGIVEFSFFKYFFNPSFLPPIIEKSALVKREITVGLVSTVGFFGGIISTGYNIHYLWNRYGLKRYISKTKREDPCLICSSLGFVRVYEHRIFHSVGVVSTEKSYLLNLPFCNSCWDNITNKKFWALKIMVLLGTIGSIFGLLFYFERQKILQQQGGLYTVFVVLVIPIIAFFLYRYIKNREDEKRCFRIDQIDDESGKICISIFDNENYTWNKKEITPVK